MIPEEMSFKAIYYFRAILTICVILVEVIIRNILWNYFAFGPVIQEMSFQHISYLELWVAPFGTIYAILAKSVMRNISVIFF